MDELTKLAFHLLFRAAAAASSLWLVWDGWRRQKIGFMAILLGLVAAATFPLGLAAYLYWRYRRPAAEHADSSGSEEV